VNWFVDEAGPGRFCPLAVRAWSGGICGDKSNGSGRVAGCVVWIGCCLRFAGLRVGAGRGKSPAADGSDGF
jgi:hypothetical protein